MIRAGVIGTGFIGPAHVEALRRIGGVEIAAIASAERSRAEEIAEKFNIARVYGDWRDVVNDPQVEVIHNCTPNRLHYAINRAAILAGKHVVSEKPLTMTSRESLALLKLVAKARVVHAVNFNYRFYPLIRQARAMVRRGAIGDVHLVHGHYLQDWLLRAEDYNWRLDPAEGGASRAVADIGSHWCDLVQYVTGKRITALSAAMTTLHRTRLRPAREGDTFRQSGPGGATPVRIRTEDAATIMFEMEGGARGAVTISQVSPGRKNREWFEIDGAKRSLAWDQENPNELWVGRRDGPNEIILKDPSLLDESARPFAHFPGGHPEGYPEGPMNLFRSVYDFIGSGDDPRRGERDYPTFVDGHRENRIAEAALASARRGRWVGVRE